MDIETLREQIVEAQMKGEDTGKLEQALKKARFNEQVEIEVKGLQEVAQKRLVYQHLAEEIMAKAKVQGEAVDRCLKLSDDIAQSLKNLIDKATALDLVKAEVDCYKEYAYFSLYGYDIQRVPRGYLPKGFTCPVLESNDSSHEKIATALNRMQEAYKCLSLSKGIWDAHNLQQAEREI